MLTARRSALHALRTSLLGVPAAYVGAAAVGAVTLRVLSGGPLQDWRPIELGDELGPLLTGTATATLTLAGFVLTMATLSVQFAATTYAPRLVEQLRRDPLLRHTLGAALATFTFGFLTAFLLPDSAEGAIALAGAVALLGALSTVLLFVALLERVTGQLRPGTIFARLAGDAREVIDAVYGERVAAGALAPDRPGTLPETVRLPREADGCAVRWPGRAATLVDAEFTELVSWASGHDARVDLTLPVGATMQHGDVIATVDGLASIDDHADAQEAVLARLVVGDERTLDGDPAWGLRLLVDAALRALSPGVNDPTTAVQSLDHARSVLLAASERQLGGRELRDEAGALRATVPAPAWPELVEEAFGELTVLRVEPRVRRAIDHALSTLIAAVPAARRPPLEACRRQLAER